MSFATTPYRPSHLALAYTQVYSFCTRKLRFISLENLEFLLLFSQESTTPFCEGNSTSVLYVSIFPGNIVESFKSHFELLEYIAIKLDWHLTFREQNGKLFREKMIPKLISLKEKLLKSVIQFFPGY